MRKIALVFPGQGSQKVGMGEDLKDFVEAKEIFQIAEKFCPNIRELCFNGPQEILDQTKYCQLAIFTVSIICYKIFKKNFYNKLDAKAYTGLSLGEYSALCASGAISIEDSFDIIKNRGLFMQSACENTDGTMAIIFDSDYRDIENICKNTKELVGVANVNCPGQIVISGIRESVVKVCNIIKDLYNKKTKILNNVSGAFHSQLMHFATLKLMPFIQKSKIHTVHNFYSSMKAKKVKASEIKKLLMIQIENPTYFQKTIENMLKEGINCFVEIGFGKSLTNIIKKIINNKSDIEIYSFGNKIEIENFSLD